MTSLTILSEIKEDEHLPGSEETTTEKQVERCQSNDASSSLSDNEDRDRNQNSKQQGPAEISDKMANTLPDVVCTVDSKMKPDKNAVNKTEHAECGDSNEAIPSEQHELDSQEDQCRIHIVNDDIDSSMHHFNSTKGLEEQNAKASNIKLDVHGRPMFRPKSPSSGRTNMTGKVLIRKCTPAQLPKVTKLKENFAVSGALGELSEDNNTPTAELVDEQSKLSIAAGGAKGQ